MMRVRFAPLCAALAALLIAEPLSAQQRPQPQRPAQPQPAAPAPRARVAPPPTEPSRIGPPTDARFAYMIDADTQAVLLDKRGEERMPPSSMTKLLTVYVAFTKIKKGELKPTDEFAVSERAYRMGGSRMFLELRSRVKVDDLLRGIIVSSGNDAAVALAEGISGTEEAFAGLMNEVARQIGMTNTNFRNASGWPEADHLTTARDLVTLALRTINDFPEFYFYYSETEFVYSGIKQDNRNPLLDKRMGVDGLKTGHTEQAGYGITVSAKRDNRRLILVVNGLNSVGERRRESERLLDLGFREYNNYPLFKDGEAVENVPVWFGDQKTLALVAEHGATVTLRRVNRPKMEVKLRYDSPLEAPIAKGQRLGSLEITAPETDKIIIPLVAATTVERQGLIGRLGSKLSHYLGGAR